VSDARLVATPLGHRRWSLVTHLQMPLHRDGYALVLNAAITAVIGLAYWMAAARLYAPDVVGLNSAVISSMMFLAGLSQLNLSNILVRFIPTAGEAVLRLVVIAYLASLAVAGIVAFLFVAGIGLWAKHLEPATAMPGFRLGFIAATMAWCVFVLQDSVLTGLGRAVLVPVENAVFAVVKLGLLLALAGSVPVYGIFVSWTAALPACLLPVSLAIFAFLVPRARGAAAQRTGAVSRRELSRYVAADYVGAISWLAATTLLPLIVTQEAGATTNAYFALGWVIAFPVYFIPSSVGSSLVVHAVRDREMLAEYARKARRQAFSLVLPASGALVLIGPLLLRLLGEEYAEKSATVLRLVAVAAIPSVINVMYVSVARVERRMRRMMIPLVSQCALVLSLAVPFLHLYGPAGVGLAWLFGQAVVAAGILATERRLLSRWSQRGAGTLEGEA
jgi:O-antigen/teichoic acid export membrane protein